MIINSFEILRCLIRKVKKRTLSNPGSRFLKIRLSKTLGQKEKPSSKKYFKLNLKHRIFCRKSWFHSWSYTGPPKKGRLIRNFSKICDSSFSWILDSIIITQVDHTYQNSQNYFTKYKDLLSLIFPLKFFTFAWYWA